MLRKRKEKKYEEQDALLTKYVAENLDLEKKLSDMIDKKLSEVAKNTEKKGEEKKEKDIGTQKPQTAETINEEKESEDSENGRS